MGYRTDLAVEALDYDAGKQSARRMRGFTRTEEESEGFSITKLVIHTEEVSQALEKPRGTYATLELGALIRREEDAFPRACCALSHLLRELLGDGDGAVLVTGLGNRSITPDAVGPLTVDHIIATRHLVSHVPEHFAGWRAVSAVAPGVLGQTGVETGELLHGLRDAVSPAAVIAVDALATGRLSNLTRTIQVTDTGIIPGSGVGNARSELSRNTLGVPVIAIGVPTVVDGATIAHEICTQAGVSGCEALDDLAQPVLVTSRDIDREVSDVARVIGYGINLALHPQLSVEDVDLYLS